MELHALKHTIPDAAIWAEERKIGAALIADGYDPQNLDLGTVAVTAKLRDLHDAAFDLGIPVRDRHYSVNRDGDVEVVFRFEREADAVNFKIPVL